jgi:hypothetical protein
VWDHKHTTTVSNKDETKEFEFNFYREDCEPERVGDMQQMHYRIVWDGYCGVGRAEWTCTLRPTKAQLLKGIVNLPNRRRTMARSSAWTPALTHWQRVVMDASVVGM